MLDKEFSDESTTLVQALALHFSYIYRLTNLLCTYNSNIYSVLNAVMIKNSILRWFWTNKLGVVSCGMVVGLYGREV